MGGAATKSNAIEKYVVGGPWQSFLVQHDLRPAENPRHAQGRGRSQMVQWSSGESPEGQNQQRGLEEKV